MLDSIKSKIVILTFALLLVLGFIVTTTAIIAFYHDRDFVIEGNNAAITAFEGQMNTEIAELEKQIEAGTPTQESLKEIAPHEFLERSSFEAELEQAADSLAAKNMDAQTKKSIGPEI